MTPFHLAPVLVPTSDHDAIKKSARRFSPVGGNLFNASSLGLRTRRPSRSYCGEPVKSSRKDECAPVDLFTHVNNAVSGARRFGGRGSELSPSHSVASFSLLLRGPANPGRPRDLSSFRPYEHAQCCLLDVRKRALISRFLSRHTLFLRSSAG